jgi:hypothetical protein
MAVCFEDSDDVWASNFSPVERLLICHDLSCLSAAHSYWIHMSFLRTDKMNWQVAARLYFGGKLYAWV